MKTLVEIKKMMAAGDTAKAAEALKELLAKEPGNLQAKMLYGACRQLLGDEVTFTRIHDELAPVMERGRKTAVPPEFESQWMTYHQTFMELRQDPLTRGSDGEVECHLYGCVSLDEVIRWRRMLEEKAKRRRLGCLLIVSLPFLFWFAWWLGRIL